VRDRFISRPVVVIADSRGDYPLIDAETDDLDIYTKEELDEILYAIKAVCRDVTVYEDPPTFIEHITLHRAALVLPFWAGRRSRNRTALLAAVSEAYGLESFGPDAYAYIIGQDKALSKHVAREFGLLTPTSVLIRSLEDLSLTELLEPPVVVKPNLQGSSIGISQDSLCYDDTQAKTLSATLLARFAEPVLVEKFIEGLEVTVTIWGTGQHILLFQAIEIYEPTGRIDFKKTLWSYELKKQPDRPVKAQRSASLSRRDELALRTLFVAMGKLGLVRIDGRLTPQGFYFLEMNPEPYLGSIGSVAKGFALQGCDYEEMFYRLLSPFDI
jgi:D-alanine-D-alanine ligase